MVMYKLMDSRDSRDKMDSRDTRYNSSMTICNDLLVNIGSYDWISPIYLTNKAFYNKYLNSKIIAVKRLQEWYRKNNKPGWMDNYDSTWKYRGTIVRLYLYEYTGVFESVFYRLPELVVNKLLGLGWIRDDDTISGLRNALAVFNQSNKRKSDVIRFLLTNKLTPQHYAEYGL